MIIFAALLSTSAMAAGTTHETYAVGMSEKMGPFGMLSGSKAQELGSEELHVVVGVFPIPIIGGVGAGWRHNFGDGRTVPFTNVTASAVYTLPAMCTTNCSIDVRPYVAGTVGLDIKVAEAQTYDFHFTVGIMSMYSVREGAVFESPSDRPAIWPVINVSMAN